MQQRNLFYAVLLRILMNENFKKYLTKTPKLGCSLTSVF